MNITIELDQLTALNIDADKAKALQDSINRHLSKAKSSEEAWSLVSKQVLTPDLPFALHLLLFHLIYPEWPNQMENAPAWFPDNHQSNISAALAELHFADYKTFYRWSIQSYNVFLQFIIDKLHLVFQKKPQQLLVLDKTTESPQWLVGAKLNIIDSIFSANPHKTAIIYREETHIKTLSYAELDKLTNQIANSLMKLGLKSHDRIAIIMPMTLHAVAMYIAIIKMGGVVVSIADSFSSDEIATRLTIANTNAVFTQDYIIRDNKQLPLYEKIKQANAPKTIVLPARQSISISLRSHDIDFKSFLMNDAAFATTPCDPMDYCNILFSSGTTGTPKAIPWTHVTAIKAASDGYFHQDIHPEDIVTWPTNLGWMMGPWLIFASLLNHATIALYEDAPMQRAFGEFIQETGVTILGLVPAIVAHWRKTQCMEGLDWHNIKLFSSSGECSNPIDMLYLMSLAGYKPIIEYCGGTEIGGSYISSTIVEKNYPSMFTTPVLGSHFILIDEQGHPTHDGEVALIPPAIGLSTEILNADHHEVYYAGMPSSSYGLLRRHGDHIKQCSNGNYIALGRVDDTMNLNGIKISAAEIERVLVGVDGVSETAAIAIPPKIPGPSQLVIYIVTKSPSAKMDLLKQLQSRINQQLNPLFKIHDIVIVNELPKTASNKIMRRVLRNQYQSSMI